jgi:hypothetical protein
MKTQIYFPQCKKKKFQIIIFLKFEIIIISMIFYDIVIFSCEIIQSRSL